MPFDPTKPATGSPNSSAEMRDQLTALKALIDAVPAGPPGPAGPQGPVFASVQIGSVTTGAPGSAASASVNTFGNNVEISFTIPEGQPGSGVTMTDVDNAIAAEITGTARNPNTVSDLSLLPAPTPTQSDLIAVIDKLNELLAALRR
ncbi:MAG: hypothetical protein RL088_2763 [Verrucomicrobiota bacterium]|jgi:hypothetical protein